jgi:hypothetical protein
MNPTVIPDVQVKLPVLVAGFSESFPHFIGPSAIPEPTSMKVPCQPKMVASESQIGGDVVGVLRLELGTVGYHLFQGVRGNVVQPVVPIQRTTPGRGRFVHAGEQGGFDVGFRELIHGVFLLPE